MERKEKTAGAVNDEALENVTGGLRSMHASAAQLKFLQRGECPRCWKTVKPMDGGWVCANCKVFFSA